MGHDADQDDGLSGREDRLTEPCDLPMSLGMVIVFDEEDSNLGGKLRRRRLSRRLGWSE